MVTGLARIKVMSFDADSHIALANILHIKDTVDGTIKTHCLKQFVHFFYFAENSEALIKLMDEYNREAISLLDLLSPSSSSSVSVVVSRLRRMAESLPAHALADVFTTVVKAGHGEKVAVLNAVDRENR